MWRGLIVLALFAHCASTYSAFREQSPSDDNQSIRSNRRAVRESPLAVATEVEDLLGEGNAPKRKQKNMSGKSDEGGYYKTYGSDAEGEKGYTKATYGKGNHGYKTLDTFHKRDGDKYAFEKHAAFGKARADKKSNHHDQDAGYGSRKGGDHEGAGTIVDSRYIADGIGRHDEHDEVGDHESYSQGDGAHYTDHGPEYSSYGHGGSHSIGDGGDGSYESHSSYSKSYGDGHEGSHRY
nr:spore wall protein 2-like [Megalopta genalis]